MPMALLDDRAEVIVVAVLECEEVMDSWVQLGDIADGLVLGPLDRGVWLLGVLLHCQWSSIELSHRSGLLVLDRDVILGQRRDHLLDRSRLQELILDWLQLRLVLLALKRRRQREWVVILLPSKLVGKHEWRLRRPALLRRHCMHRHVWMWLVLIHRGVDGLSHLP